MTTVATRSIERFRDEFIAALLRGVPENIARLSWESGRITAHQREGLRSLVLDALESSPFHARRLAGIDPASLELADLPSLPVMTKAEMMANFDEVVTDRRLGRQLVEQSLAEAETEPVPILEEYIALASGGSSGERGIFLFDQAALVQFVGAVTRSLMARMAASGGIPPGGLTIALVAASSPVHATGAAPALTAHPDSPFRFVPIPATLPLAEIIARLNELRPPLLFGYPSLLARLAAQQSAGSLEIAPIGITTTSETLHPELRKAISEGFGVPIVDSFGSSEGLIGTSAPDSPVLVFSSDLCILELVDDNQQPVPRGTSSSKVLLTNLYNHTQPLIRYELSDRFREQADVPDHGHLRAIVEGRSDEILRYGSVEVHPHVIRAVLVRSPAVADYQVHQTGRGIAVRVLADPSLKPDQLSGELRAALAETGLSEPEVMVEIAERLGRDPATGKLRRFVPAD